MTMNTLMVNTVKVYKTIICELSGFRSQWLYQLEVVERNIETGSDGSDSEDGLP